MPNTVPAVSSQDVVVIGGGLHGCSAAQHLALRGKRVAVLEKNSVGRHASGVNAGGVRRLAGIWRRSRSRLLRSSSGSSSKSW